ncbi:MAG: hypothetical protein M1401_16945 [Chloroflexi bacterium]|nr:hypothetical protein [Chloroflexota bacterium]
MDNNIALARFLRRLAEMANQLATEVEEQARSTAQSAELPGQARPEMLVRGGRQRAIVALPELRDEEGMKTADIARALGYSDVPNVHISLRTLERRGLVELVPNRVPQRWRLVHSFRRRTRSTNREG